MRKYKEIKEKLWEYRNDMSGDLDTRNTQEILGWSTKEERYSVLTSKKPKRIKLKITPKINEVHVYVNFGSKTSNKYTEDMPSENYSVYIDSFKNRMVTEINLDDNDRNLLLEGRVDEIDFSKYVGG